MDFKDFPEPKLYPYGRCVMCGKEGYLDHNGCCEEERCIGISVDMDEERSH